MKSTEEVKKLEETIKSLTKDNEGKKELQKEIETHKSQISRLTDGKLMSYNIL